jgi:hypothetical protein
MHLSNQTGARPGAEIDAEIAGLAALQDGTLEGLNWQSESCLIGIFREADIARHGRLSLDAAKNRAA